MDGLSMVLDSVKILYIQMNSFDLNKIIGLLLLSMSGEVVYKGDNFTHIGSPHIVY